MKKLLLLLACVLTSLTMQGYDFEVDGLYYKILTSDQVAVTYQGTNPYQTNHYSFSKLIIPETVSYSGKTYTVTQIGDYAFQYAFSLQSIILPQTITKIGSNAFDNCIVLKSIGFSNSLKEIDAHAFAKCKSLTVIELPNTVTTIRQYAFWECEYLSSIIIGNSIRNIEGPAFEGCSKLKSITMLANRPPSGAGSLNQITPQPILTVPASAYNAYISISPWMLFTNIITYDDSEGTGSNKCSAPEVTFSDNTLSFSCATPQSQIHYSYYLGNMGTAEPGGDMVVATNKTNSLIVMAYATAEGYEQSAAVIKSFPFDATIHDINGDNKVTVADVTALIDIIVNK